MPASVHNLFKNNPDLKYWLGFAHLTNIGPVRFRRIYLYFNSLKQAWQATQDELIHAGIEPKLAEQIVVERQDINLEEKIETLAQENIFLLTIKDPNYPKLLQEIYDAPPVLFYKGQFSPDDEFALAVVGTRKYSSYGKQVATAITSDLARSGLVIVSGLALGIDALAHESCLSVQGRTIAVLGSGLNMSCVYPSYNRYLFEKILYNGGLIFSEYPPGTQATRFTFPRRNRIVAGLSKGTLVIEAPESSGALLTAKIALEQNREVFAVPGSIYAKNCVGTNKLIKLGAKPVTSSKDILEGLNLDLVKEFNQAKKVTPETQEEALVYQHLSQDPMHIDELKRLTKLDTNIINATLTLMEMKGSARNLGGMNYIKI